MIERHVPVTFSPEANRDKDGLYDFLLDAAGFPVAERYLDSLEYLTVLLERTPLIGRTCEFRRKELRWMRRLLLGSPYGRWLLFYTPGQHSSRIERILHSAQDWRTIIGG